MTKAMLDFAIEEVNAGRAFRFSPVIFTKAELALLREYVALKRAGIPVERFLKAAERGGKAMLVICVNSLIVVLPPQNGQGEPPSSLKPTWIHTLPARSSKGLGRTSGATLVPRPLEHGR